jgi:Arc/MetJ-type ribon-helix-helix transcriptional regulator
MVDLVQRKVASGEYADESDVISDSLALLEDREHGLERWLREEIVPVCLAFEGDSSTAMSAAELLADLDAARRDRQ